MVGKRCPVYSLHFYLTLKEMFHGGVGSDYTLFYKTFVFLTAIPSWLPCWLLEDGTLALKCETLSEYFK